MHLGLALIALRNEQYCGSTSILTIYRVVEIIRYVKRNDEFRGI